MSASIRVNIKASSLDAKKIATELRTTKIADGVEIRQMKTVDAAKLSSADHRVRDTLQWLGF